MSETLFIGVSNGVTLEELSRSVFPLLGIHDWEERFSSNYPPDGHYFVGYARNVELELYDADPPPKADYPVHLDINRPSSRRGVPLVEAELQEVARRLAAAGFNVFVPSEGWSREDWNGSGALHAPQQAVQGDGPASGGSAP